MLWLLSGPQGFTCWISFAPVFSFIYCWVLIFAISPFYTWFICSSRCWIDKGSFMQTKHLQLYVSRSTSELRVRLAPWKRLSPPVKYFYLPFQGGTSFVDHSCYFCLVFVMLSAASVYWSLVSPAGIGLTSWLSFVMSDCEFLFSH